MKILEAYAIKAELFINGEEIAFIPELEAKLKDSGSNPQTIPFGAGVPGRILINKGEYFETLVYDSGAQSAAVSTDGKKYLAINGQIELTSVCLGEKSNDKLKPFEFYISTANYYGIINGSQNPTEYVKISLKKY